MQSERAPAPVQAGPFGERGEETGVRVVKSLLTQAIAATCSRGVGDEEG